MAASIERAIMSEVRAAMNEAESKSFQAAKEEASGRYTVVPKYYKWTGTLADAPMSTGVSGGGNTLNFRVYLNQNRGYSTGTFSAAEVQEAAEMGSCGIVGRPGYWQRTIQRTIEATIAAFSSRF